MASAKSKQKQKQKQKQQLALRQDDGVGDENDDENEIQETKANRFKALQLITVAKDYFAERKRKAAEKKKAEEDDPFANLDVSKDWGWLEQYQEKKKEATENCRKTTTWRRIESSSRCNTSWRVPSGRHE